MHDPLSADLASLRISRDVDPDRRPIWQRALIVLVVLGLIAGGVALGLPRLRAHFFRTEVVVTEIALVSPAQASVELTSTGYVVPQTLARVGVKVIGRVTRVAVHEGDRVKAGDLLFQIDNAEQTSALGAAQARVQSARAREAAARARVETARAGVAETKTQYDREKGLADNGVGPRASAENLEKRLRVLEDTLRAAEAEVTSASAEIAQNEAEVKTLEAGLSNTTVLAPIDGIVLNRPPEVGDLLSPAVATSPVLEIADFASLRVECDVPEGRLEKVRPDGPAEIILDAFPGKRFRGAVHEISPRLNRAKATALVKVRFIDPPDGVLPEMAARVSFLAKELGADEIKAPPKIVVPSSAIADRQGGKVVFVVGEGDTLRMVAVTLGPVFGTGYELTHGPPAGTRVVKGPTPALTDGQQIKEKTE